jgi:hypothetical protein
MTGAKGRLPFLSGEQGVLLQRAMLFLLPAFGALALALGLVLSQGPEDFDSVFGFQPVFFAVIWGIDAIAILILLLATARARLTGSADKEGASEGLGPKQ